MILTKGVSSVKCFKRNLSKKVNFGKEICIKDTFIKIMKCSQSHTSTRLLAY